MCGGYVNFGVFGLYGDNALEEALKTFVELLSSIPHSNLLVRCLTELLFDVITEYHVICSLYQEILPQNLERNI